MQLWRWCRASGCAPVIVAAGHYPLSVVAHPDAYMGAGGDGTLRGLLAGHGVAAWLCGHLHGLFSQRQHLLHPGRGGGATLLLTANKAAAAAVRLLHTQGT